MGDRRSAHAAIGALGSRRPRRLVNRHRARAAPRRSRLSARIRLESRNGRRGDCASNDGSIRLGLAWWNLRELCVSGPVARRRLLVVVRAGVARKTFAAVRENAAARLRIHVLQWRRALRFRGWPPRRRSFPVAGADLVCATKSRSARNCFQTDSMAFAFRRK